MIFLGVPWWGFDISLVSGNIPGKNEFYFNL